MGLRRDPRRAQRPPAARMRHRVDVHRMPDLVSAAAASLAGRRPARDRAISLAVRRPAVLRWPLRALHGKVLRDVDSRDAHVSDNAALFALHAGADIAVVPLKANLHASGCTVIQETTLLGLPVVCTREDGGGTASGRLRAAVCEVVARGAGAGAPSEHASIRARSHSRPHATPSARRRRRLWRATPASHPRCRSSAPPAPSSP